jgi:hypothetical protein
MSLRTTEDLGGCASARIGLWRGADERGSTGLVVADGHVARCAFEVPAVPDFGSPRFPDLAGLDEAARVQRVAETQSQLLGALHALGPGFGFSLRYVCAPSPGGAARVRLFLVGRSFDVTEAGAAQGALAFRQVVRASAPEGYRFQEISPAEDGELLSLDAVTALVEIMKPEEVLPAWHDPALCGFPFYYLPRPFAPAENDMVAVCASLIDAAASRPVGHPSPRAFAPSEDSHGPLMVDVTLVPASPLTPVERNEISLWESVCERWARDQKLKVGGGLYSGPTPVEIAADPNADTARKGYADLLSRYGSPHVRCFLYAVRVLSSAPLPADAVGAALAARALSPSCRPQFVALDTRHPAFARALNAARLSYVTPAVCNERFWTLPDAPETLRRLHRLAEVREVAAFFRLPIPGRDGCPGLPTDLGLPETPSASRISTRERPASPPLVLGQFAERGTVLAEGATLSPADLTKHGLIVGTPGSGKTTLCFSLLAQLWEDHRVPFLAIEPAKTEYRALLGHPALEDDLLVFTVGNERVSPFRLNPFEVLPGEAVSEHLSSLLACFHGAFRLFDPLPMILEAALREAYAEKGWSEFGVGGEDPDLVPPMMADLYRHALRLAEGSSYKGETAGNIRGALETRLGSLLRGPRGRCLNTLRSVPMDILMTRPVVLELDALSEEEKALVALFLLTRIRAHAKAHPQYDRPLRHVTLLEEAHVVIGRGDGTGSAERANPQAVAVRLFTRMLAEMRALGEGVLIADQLPTAIAPEAVKLTNLKVMHRVVALEDRQDLGGAMALDPGQVEGAATLPPGASYVFQEGWPKSRLVIERNFKDETGVGVPPPDDAVRERMAPFRESEDAKGAYLPYRTCGALCRACDPKVREEMERWTERKDRAVRERLIAEKAPDPTTVALTEFFRDLPLLKEEPIRTHCAREHFWNAFGGLAKPPER